MHALPRAPAHGPIVYQRTYARGEAQQTTSLTLTQWISNGVRVQKQGFVNVVILDHHREGWPSATACALS